MCAELTVNRSFKEKKTLAPGQALVLSWDQPSCWSNTQRVSAPPCEPTEQHQSELIFTSHSIMSACQTSHSKTTVTHLQKLHPASQVNDLDLWTQSNVQMPGNLNTCFRLVTVTPSGVYQHSSERHRLPTGRGLMSYALKRGLMSLSVNESGRCAIQSLLSRLQTSPLQRDGCTKIKTNEQSGTLKTFLYSMQILLHFCQLDATYRK